jgi:hypothetical protein
LIYIESHVTGVMAKDAQILIRVEPDTKEQWEQEADERGFRGLAGFVRFAVNNEIDGRHTESGTADDTVNFDIEDAVEAAEQANKRTRTIDDRLGAIEAAVDSLQDEITDEDGGAVAPELVTDTLPTQSPNKRVESDTEDGKGYKTVRKSVSELRKHAMKPEDVADELGVSVPPVRNTLERLDLKSGRVKSVEYEDGQRGYFSDV